MSQPKIDVTVPSEELVKKGEELVRKVERESRFRRKFDKPWNYIITVISVLFVSYHIITSRFGMPEVAHHRSIHLGFIMVLLFLYFPATPKSPKTRPSIVDIGLSLLGLAVCAFWYFDINTFATRGGSALPYEYFVGGLAILLVLEGCRRAVGPQLLMVCIVLLTYAYAGKWIPGVLGHRGYSVQRIIYQMFLTDQGIWGIPLGVSATYMIIFVILAATMSVTGLGKLFTDVALGATGRTTGGPAKIAVVASGLLGLISGGAATNVATTGAFTIPLMKKMGYEPYFAGAVEAAASTGGQIMPPVMGTVAFLMADYLGVPYAKVAASAFIPAVLYFAGVFWQVDLRARQLGLRGLREDEMPDWRKTVKQYWHMLLPIVVLVYLLMNQFTPIYAAFYTLVLSVALAYLRPETRIYWNKYVQMCVDAGRTSIGIALAMANAGFVCGVLGMTGLGLIVADGIVTIAAGRMFIALFLTMVVAIILGMGLPTTACYVISSAIAVPILTKMGVPAYQAHFFCLYFACLSTVTPPVALAAYVGAGLANADPSRVGWAAFRLALAGFIVPFFFVYSPVMLLIAESPLQIVWAAITGFIGVMFLAIAAEGFCWGRLPAWLRVGFLTAAVLFMDPGLLTDAIGFGLGGVSLLVAWTVAKRRERTPQQPLTAKA